MIHAIALILEGAARQLENGVLRSPESLARFMRQGAAKIHELSKQLAEMTRGRDAAVEKMNALLLSEQRSTVEIAALRGLNGRINENLRRANESIARWRARYRENVEPGALRNMAQRLRGFSPYSDVIEEARRLLDFAAGRIDYLLNRDEDLCNKLADARDTLTAQRDLRETYCKQLEAEHEATRSRIPQLEAWIDSLRAEVGSDVRRLTDALLYAAQRFVYEPNKRLMHEAACALDHRSKSLCDAYAKIDKLETQLTAVGRDYGHANAEIERLIRKNAALEAQYLDVGRAIKGALGHSCAGGTLPDLFRHYVKRRDQQVVQLEARLTADKRIAAVPGHYVHESFLHDLQREAQELRQRIAAYAEQHKIFERVCNEHGLQQVEISNLKARIDQRSGDLATFKQIEATLGREIEFLREQIAGIRAQHVRDLDESIDGTLEDMADQLRRHGLSVRVVRP